MSYFEFKLHVNVPTALRVCEARKLNSPCVSFSLFLPLLSFFVSLLLRLSFRYLAPARRIDRYFVPGLCGYINDTRRTFTLLSPSPFFSHIFHAKIASKHKARPSPCAHRFSSINVNRRARWHSLSVVDTLRGGLLHAAHVIEGRARRISLSLSLVTTTHPRLDFYRVTCRTTHPV